MDRICPSCGSIFVAGLLMNNFPYCNACTPPAITQHCPGCEAAARERDTLQAKLDTAMRACEDAYESHASMHARLQQVIEGSKRKERAFDILSDQQTDIDDALMGLPAKTSIGKTIEGLCASRRESNVLRSGIEAMAGECEDGNLIDCRLSDHMQELCNCKEVAGKLRALLAETEAK